jgi:hypothetical protein
MLHCSENTIYVFPEMELHGLLPNSYIHVSVSDLYIPRLIGLLIWVVFLAFGLIGWNQFKRMEYERGCLYGIFATENTEKYFLFAGEGGDIFRILYIFH